MRVPGLTEVVCQKRDPFLFSEQKFDGNDTESEESLVPWDQALAPDPIRPQETVPDLLGPENDGSGRANLANPREQTSKRKEARLRLVRRTLSLGAGIYENGKRRL